MGPPKFSFIFCKKRKNQRNFLSYYLEVESFQLKKRRKYLIKIKMVVEPEYIREKRFQPFDLPVTP